MLLDVKEHRAGRCSERRSTTRPARRSTRARGCSASATRAAPRSIGSAREGDAEAFSFPVARLDGLDFSFSGVKTALLYAVRDLGDGAEERRPISPRATSARSCARSSSGRRRRPRAPEPSGSPSSAASPRTRSCVRGSWAPSRAARAVHGQRRDDRLGRAVRGGRPVSRLPWAGCVCVGSLTSPRRGLAVVVLTVARAVRRSTRRCRRVP